MSRMSEYSPVNTDDGNKPRDVSRSLVIGVGVGVGLVLLLVVILVPTFLLTGGNGKDVLILPSTSIIVPNDDLSTYIAPLNALQEDFNKKNADYKENYVPCMGDQKPDEKYCLFEIKWLKDTSTINSCSKADDWGYKQNSSKPCVILMPKKDETWMPKPYETLDELPANMPETLKDAIKEHSLIPGPEKNIQKMYWVSCTGDTAKDTDNLGSVSMTPYNGFRAIFFPYKNSPQYLQPLLGLSFPDLKSGVEVNVVCQIWANNYDPSENPLRFTIKI